MVFRPATYAFPRARGRTGFDLKSDGLMVDYGVGAGDASTENNGRWEIHSDGMLCLFHGRETTPDRKMKVRSVHQDKLVLERQLT